MNYTVSESPSGPRIAWEGGTHVYDPAWAAANHAVMLLQRLERALEAGKATVDAGFLPPLRETDSYQPRPLPLPAAMTLAHDLFAAAWNSLRPVVAAAEAAVVDGAHAACDEVPAGELDPVGGE